MKKTKSTPKTYILDTNILMNTEGRVLFGFDDNVVCITTTTLEELDHLKTAPAEKGFQARESIRQINSIIETAPQDIKYGVKINDNKGYFVILDEKTTDSIPKSWDSSHPDNRIISTVISYIKDYPERDAILVTNDVSMKIKGLVLGLKVESYRNDQVKEENQYSGRRVSGVPIDDINKLYKDKEIWAEGYCENEFVHVTDNVQGNALCIFKKNALQLISDVKQVFGITPKNQGQRFALEALMAPADEIPLVVIKGPAGTGKTLLSLAAALDQTYDNDAEYDRVMISRANILADEEMGFLPGDLSEKMMPLLGSFTDNLRYLLGANGEEKDQINIQLEDMFATGVIEALSLAYLRGRSPIKSYVIIDEAQNLTRHQVKTIVTRMGEGCKLVFLGDPNQIDNPKLDKRNNGLAYLSERFKGSELCAQIEFLPSESVRSPLVLEALERLD